MHSFRIIVLCSGVMDHGCVPTENADSHDPSRHYIRKLGNMSLIYSRSTCSRYRDFINLVRRAGTRHSPYYSVLLAVLVASCMVGAVPCACPARYPGLYGVCPDYLLDRSRTGIIGRIYWNNLDTDIFSSTISLTRFI